MAREADLFAEARDGFFSCVNCVTIRAQRRVNQKVDLAESLELNVVFAENSL